MSDEGSWGEIFRKFLRNGSWGFTDHRANAGKRVVTRALKHKACLRSLDNEDRIFYIGIFCYLNMTSVL